MLSYEIVNLFGSLALLFCAFVGLTMILQATLARAFVPACREIAASLRRILGKSAKKSRGVPKPSMTPLALRAGDAKKANGHAAAM